MLQTKPINKFNVNNIIEAIIDGRHIYRINVENNTVTDLGLRSVKQIIKDEQNEKRYAYFEVIMLEPEEETPLDAMLEAYEKTYIMDPPSNNLIRAAQEYGIHKDGLTTKAILLEIAKQEIK